MKVFGGIFLVAAITFSFGTGFFLGANQTETPIEGVGNKEVGKPSDVDFSLFWDAWRTLQDKYIEGGKLDYKAMVQGAISGMVESLQDPYTTYMDSAQTERFLEDVSGSFGGVGIEIGIREEQLKVIAPLEGTPAQKAGLRAGDHIWKIDETYTKDLTTDQAVSLIRGDAGTSVALHILREGWNQSKEFNITRAIIQIPSLKLEMKEGIAHVRLYQFSEKASFDFQKAVVEIVSGNVSGIVLDLRNNPGGLLEVSRDIAGWFLQKDSVVTIEDFGDYRGQEIYKTRGSGQLKEYPLVVLINEGSASASEILAGALRDNRDIQLIGMQSFGKGSVQELQRLRDDSSLKVTIAKWLTPKGEQISNVGLAPDIEVEMTDKDFEEERDPQLDRAIELVKNL